MCYLKRIFLSILSVSVAAAAHVGLRKSDTNFDRTKGGEVGRSLGVICDYDCECREPYPFCYKLKCDEIGACTTKKGNCNASRTCHTTTTTTTSTTTTTTTKPIEDCEPKTAEETRKGIKYEFERFGGSDKVCTDYNDDQYDYGQFKLYYGDDADDCAKECVHEPDRDTLEHLRGFDWNCDQSLCRCLYENNELCGSDKYVFDSFNNDNSGEGSVKHTDSKYDWRCYKLSTTSPNEDCEPKTAEETRKGIKYEFERFGESDRVCTDYGDNKYDYGQFKLHYGDDADDCAKECVDEPDRDTLEHLRGFDWNCDELLCRCLYENNELSGSDKNGFDSFNSDNNGEGSVKHTNSKYNWRCYKLSTTTTTTTTTPNKDCEPEKVEQNRRGIKYKFERKGSSDQMCTDYGGKEYDYGQFNVDNDDTADRCATKCVNRPERPTLDHLRGFDWNCDKSRCRCLYDNNELSERDEEDFDSFDKYNSGVGSVKGTKSKDNSRCYKLASKSVVENV